MASKDTEGPNRATKPTPARQEEKWASHHPAGAVPLARSPTTPGVRRSALGAIDGNVAAVFALVVAALMAISASAIDFRDWLRAHSETRAAVDAALIAGLRALQIDRRPPDVAMGIALQTYSENVKQRTRMLSDSVTFAITDEGSGVQATGVVLMRPRLLQLLDIGSLTVIDLSGGHAAKAVRTVGVNAQQSLETVIVTGLPSRLDQIALDGLKTAVRALADLVVWPDRYSHSSRLGLVPFSTTVNLDALASLVAKPSLTSSLFNLASGQQVRLRPTTCISEREGAAAYSDAPPAAAGGVDVPIAVSRFGTCLPAATVKLPTSDRSPIDTAIDTWVPGGSASAQVGLAWGWYLLSPRWAGVLPFEAAPAPYDATVGSGGGSAAVRKVVVFIFDGGADTQACVAAASGTAGMLTLPDRQSDGAAAPTGDCLSPNGLSAQQASTLCSRMKAAGLEVYTITYPSTSVVANPRLMSECASRLSDAYQAATPAELLQVMRGIAMRLTSLLLTN